MVENRDACCGNLPNQGFQFNREFAGDVPHVEAFVFFGRQSVELREGAVNLLETEVLIDYREADWSIGKEGVELGLTLADFFLLPPALGDVACDESVPAGLAICVSQKREVRSRPEYGSVIEQLLAIVLDVAIT